MDKTIGGKSIGWYRYKDRVRTFLPIGEKVRANHIIEKARQQHMNPTKVYECLKIMADEGEVMKLKDKPKEAFYVRFEDARIENLIESFFSELKMALEGMSDEDKIVRKEVMNFALDFVRGSNLPQREQEKIIKEVDKRSIGRVAYFLLLKRVFETIKMVEPELEKEEFYVDSEGSFVPKEWVDKKITLKSRMDWQTKVFRFPKK